MSTSDLDRLRIPREPDSRPAARRGDGGGRRPWPWVLALIAVALAAWVVLRPRAVEVRTTTVQMSGGAQAGGDVISASGYVVARTKASVSAKVAGRMEQLSVTEGSRVRRGEVIARIESAAQRAAVGSARAAVQQVEAELGQARRDRDRAEALIRANVLSEADAENARTRVQMLEAQRASARSQVREAEVALENTNVRAPFDGTVLRKDAEVGEIVSPASAGGGLTRTAIVTMADLATLEVEVDVNEAFIARIRNGQPALITLDAYPDTSFRGQIRQIVPTADRQKATVQVKVSILDRDPRILPEMGAKVNFLADTALAAPAPRRLSVDATAVVSSAAGTRAWVVVDGRVAARDVVAGAPRDGRVVIERGLSAGDVVVLNPPPSLKDGAAIRIRED